MLAFQISRDPIVKQTVRQVFYEKAKIQIIPTKKGKKVKLHISKILFTVNKFILNISTVNHNIFKLIVIFASIVILVYNFFVETFSGNR